MIIKLAWRNIWRNKRRTLLTISAVAFAVFFSSFMGSFQKGAWDHMMYSVVNSFYGFGQIHADGYWDEQSLDKAFDPTEAVTTTTQKEGVEGVVQRIESFALGSFDKYTNVAFVIGTSPENEDKMTELSKRLVAGTYFIENEKSVLVGKGVAEKLKLTVNDTMVLLGQGYRGVNAAGKFKVKGLLDFPSPELNKTMVYMPLKAASDFYRTDGLVTTVAIDFKNEEYANTILPQLKSELSPQTYEVMNWKELLPELQQAREVDTGGAMVMLFVLYLIITFVIFGTILMLTKERMHEFGILTAIGMSKAKLANTVWLEIIILGLIGALAGIIFGGAITYYFHINPLDLSVMGEDAVKTYESFGVEPIFPAAFDLNIFYNQAIIVFVLTTLLSIYPIVKILKLNTIAAMRD